MTASKQEALDLLELHRKEWLAEARATAAFYADLHGSVTVDDVRALCPIPEGIDGRVMGAVFNTKEWKAGPFINSRRRACHRRPIRVFERVG